MGVLNDDAVALFMLLNSPNVEVLGVTIVPGNTWAENGTAYALRQLELVGRSDVPVFIGVREPLMGSRQAVARRGGTAVGPLGIPGRVRTAAARVLHRARPRAAHRLRDDEAVGRTRRGLHRPQP